MSCYRFLFLSTVCVSAMVFSPVQRAEADLVGYWNFDGNVEDQSGTGNDGELVDASYSDNVPDAIGNGQSIDLEDDFAHVFVEADDSLDSEEFTLSLFVFDRGQVGALERLTSRDQDTFETAINALPGFDGGLGQIAYFSKAGGGWKWTGPTHGNDDDIVLELETWQHLAYVADADEQTMTIYLDGELIHESLDPWFTSPTGFMHIGNRWNDVEGFDGMLDDVALWDEVLSQEQIRSIAEGGVACFVSEVPCGGIEGDYNGNGEIDAGDLDVQSQYIKDNNLAGDINGDGATDRVDRVSWIKTIQKSWVGDSNFDGEFNSSDFVSVFQVGKYETGEMATYAEGDWNGDMVFNSSDFVAAFQDGGFEQGPLPQTTAVPEPSGISLLSLSVLALYRRWRIRCRY